MRHFYFVFSLNNSLHSPSFSCSRYDKWWCSGSKRILSTYAHTGGALRCRGLGKRRILAGDLNHRAQRGQATMFLTFLRMLCRWLFYIKITILLKNAFAPKIEWTHFQQNQTSITQWNDCTMPPDTLHYALASNTFVILKTLYTALLQPQTLHCSFFDNSSS